MPDLIRHDNRIIKTKARRHKPKKQKRGGASRPKDNFIIPPNHQNKSAAAQTKKTEARRRKPPERYFYYSTLWFGPSVLLGMASVLIRPLARLGFCSDSAACAARLLLILSHGPASVPDAFVIPASEPVSSFSGCRVPPSHEATEGRQARNDNRNFGAIHRTLQ